MKTHAMSKRRPNTARSLPPLNALRAFEAAARLGSFKAAAAELSVTHGAISRHIALLEAWLRTSLFERRNRRVILTAAASAYLSEVGPAFDRVAAATAQYGAAAQILRVNGLATFSLRWLVPRLARFQRQHPGVEVRLDTSNEPVDALRDTYDTVIRGGPDTFYGYAVRPFLSEERLPVCSPALLDLLPLDQPADLRRHTLLHASTLPRVWSEWLDEAGVPSLTPAASLTFDHFYLTLQAALDGVGVAMGPTALVADDIARRRLVAPFAGPALPARSYCTYVPTAKAAKPMVAAFCDWLEQEASAFMAKQAPGGRAVSRPA
jgi:LysR family glycine cleavage system transcriptional activator